MKIAIIGGTRGLGAWIATFLSRRDVDIVVTGRNRIAGESISRKLGVEYIQDNVKSAAIADIVIISVPIDVTSDTIKEVGAVMKEGSLLMDVTSVKKEPTEIMEQYVARDVEVLPCHPMFGPRIRSLDGQVIVLTPLNKGKWYNIVFNFLESENARVIVTSPDMHDRMMSIVQGLTHFAYISIARTIKEFDIDIKESRKFASPTYNLMLDTIARITAQNPYLEYSILTKNCYIKKTYESFLKTASELKDLISNENQKEFVNSMSSAAKHIDDLESALGRSDKAVSVLTQELSILKRHVGLEVGLKHIYSGKVHIGILDKLTPEFLVLTKNKNNFVYLKLSNVEVLNNEDLLQWKLENYPKKCYDVSEIFPEGCNPDIIADTIENLDNVVNAEVIDIYDGSQIPLGYISITFRYCVIDKNASIRVEKLLNGFGSKLR